MQAHQVDYEKITADLKTKSDKIRALSRHGVSTADIARYLDIRYQHARNVLKEAGLHRTMDSASNTPGKPHPAFAWVELCADGSLTVPSELLAGADIQPGLVQVRPTKDGLELFSRQAALARLQAMAAPFKRPGASEVDEFIAERRREAERE
jgi:hypothetical protein